MGVSREVRTLYDEPMWASIEAREIKLQACASCHAFRYPPAPVCAHCFSMEAKWLPLSGAATILSWVVFHRKYFDDFEPPYNAITVQLEEGPIMVSNLTGAEPEGSWIGRTVELCYVERTSGRVLPQFRLAADAVDRA